MRETNSLVNIDDFLMYYKWIASLLKIAPKAIYQNFTAFENIR